MSYQIVNFKKLALTKFGVHTSMFIDTSVQKLAKSFKKKQNMKVKLHRLHIAETKSWINISKPPKLFLHPQRGREASAELQADD